jgi:hypothetical protein
MATPAESRFLRRRWEGFEIANPEDLHRGRDLLRADLDLLEVLQHREDVEDVTLDRDVAGHVRPTEPELVGRGDDPAQRVGRANDHARRRVGRAEAAPVVRTERNRDVRSEHAREEVRDGHGCASQQATSSSVVVIVATSASELSMIVSV